MKYLAGIGALTLIDLEFFTGCTRTPSHTAARPTTPYYISATLSGGGTFYVSDSSIYSDGTVGGNVKIEGTLPPGTQIEFWFNSYTATVGTYSLDGITRGGSYLSPPPYGFASSAYGTITFTSVTPSVVGTFSFTRTDSVVVAGSFNVPAP